MSVLCVFALRFLVRRTDSNPAVSGYDADRGAAAVDVGADLCRASASVFVSCFYGQTRDFAVKAAVDGASFDVSRVILRHLDINPAVCGLHVQTGYLP